MKYVRICNIYFAIVIILNCLNILFKQFKYIILLSLVSSFICFIGKLELNYKQHHNVQKYLIKLYLYSCAILYHNCSKNKYVCHLMCVYV